MDLQFDSILNNPKLGDLDLKIFSLLSDLLTAKLDPSTAAQQINRLFPRPDGILPATYLEDVDEFLWIFWGMVIEIIQLVPYQHRAQEYMLSMLQSLSGISQATVKIWSVESKVWQELPLLGSYLRDNWISPTYQGKVPEAQDAEKWKSLNSFAARMLGKRLGSWWNFAMWELQAALEEEYKDQAIADCNVTVACEWIVHSGDYIFEQIGNADGQSEQGPLYSGPPGLCLERWNFWKRRLREMSQLVSGPLKHEVLSAADRMDKLVN
ncbi:hypothetical protein ASPZODRAFT_128923 [Penicilliopsis zonata CBS 506.65]|uniref:Uncharacterized protein n=1 Tax=Penicilliopsis zonata CBS 506.65 TaxID=1073090 RepID=A0A1L9ST82_9EURO|nr:hypothetical protein ASPZODRAFT_128923 [Penicilliopsis zonata CBS 506.65]OJJ50303.1 hypothetical protein ASPZODRAFT_128923 [Penicilliopsis zonata CBS 506.65]